ncbi:Hsp20/alpha crystallin family protein [Thalassoglobus sp. JC818]|uniref:Hsp20/alpha crystallin family protein n=1 Tax=Thalassoglobus sp. JC818 TaxID=3232136 RepID=UPI003458CB57
MPVFRWGSAFDAFRDLEREVDRWVRSMDIAFENPRIGRPYPMLNLYDLGSEYLITAELSGCTASELDLTVANGVVTMRGVRTPAGDVPEDRFRRRERPVGNWERSISVPERINDDDVRAELNDGLLKLYLPKTPSAAPKQIPVTKGRTEITNENAAEGESR